MSTAQGRNGSERPKIALTPILDLYDVSPDGRWVANQRLQDFGTVSRFERRVRRGR